MAAYKKIKNDKVRSRIRRKYTIRRKISGTSERPRLCVFRLTKHIYVQAIDDLTHNVLAAVSDLDKEISPELKGLDKKAKARKIGETIGKQLLDKKLNKVVFDRNGFIFHGRVKELADGARDVGLDF